MDEDKEQFVNTINNLIVKSKMKMDEITSNRDKVNTEDIELLKMCHEDLEKNLFEFKKKAQFISKDVSNGFQELWEKYEFAEEINLDTTNKYYENLLKRIGTEEIVTLNDDDIPMLEAIYNLYSDIRKDINNIL